MTVAQVCQLVKLLSNGGFQLTKVVNHSFQVCNVLQKDVTLGNPFREMKIATKLGVEWDFKQIGCLFPAVFPIS